MPTVNMRYGSRGSAAGKSGGSGFNPVLVWETEDATASFAAQTLALDLSDFKWVIIVCNYTTATTNVVTQLVPVGSTALLSLVNSTYNRAASRTAAVATDGVTVSACTYNGATSNTTLIPIKIFAI